MVSQRTLRVLALAAGVGVALPAAAAQAKPASPAAHAAGGAVGATPDPPIVGIPITRTDSALGNAADAIDAGNAAQAVAPLTAASKYLTRSYRGARYLINTAPATPPAAAGRVRARTYVRLARGAVSASRSGTTGNSAWIRAHKSGGAPAGPAFADAPTSVFDVFTSQFNAATASAGMLPDATGAALTGVTGTITAAQTLRSRLVRFIHTKEPTPPPAAAGRVRAHKSGGAVVGTSFGAVMPGLTVLLDAEMQQMQLAARDRSLPTASRATLTRSIAADRRLEGQVNTWWPPAPPGADG
jgi:hypothetical protein